MYLEKGGDGVADLPNIDIVLPTIQNIYIFGFECPQSDQVVFELICHHYAVLDTDNFVADQHGSSQCTDVVVEFGGAEKRVIVNQP